MLEYTFNLSRTLRECNGSAKAIISAWTNFNPRFKRAPIFQPYLNNWETHDLQWFSRGKKRTTQIPRGLIYLSHDVLISARLTGRYVLLCASWNKINDEDLVRSFPSGKYCSEVKEKNYPVVAKAWGSFTEVFIFNSCTINKIKASYVF